jgi:uroporphyrinogen-III synthase
MPLPSSPLLPLTGKTIVVTRPREQADNLVKGISALGGAAFRFPLLVIQPLSNTAPLMETAIRLADFHCVIFVSINAARLALPILLPRWPSTLPAAAVGASTARALTTAGISRVLMPATRFDSEGLLALPAFSASQLAGKHVLLCKGEGGRELLADTLRTRGATITTLPLYRRLAPGEGLDAFAAGLAAQRFDALTLSSSESVCHLMDCVSADAACRTRLLALPVFTSHARVVETASAAGFRAVQKTGEGDAGLLVTLSAYNWYSS